MKKIYIIMCFLITKFIIAQSPGGISTNLQLWYKADAGVITSASSEVTTWNNQASPSFNLVQQGMVGTIPVYNAGLINFNPAIRFDGVNDRLYTPNLPQNVTTSNSAPYPTSQYIVYKQLGATFNPLYSHSNGNGGTWNIGAGSGGTMLITNRFVATSAPVQNEVRLQSLNGNSTAATSYLNGVSMSSSPTGTVSTAGIQSFWVGGQGTNNFINIDVGEIVIYNAAQSNFQQIESYLALKYGISKFGNYIASDGITNYWNATANVGYSNFVAGIGHDDGSGLYQKQSMSQNPGNQVLIGLTGMANTNSANTGNLTDGQFLVWGDNGLAKSLREPLTHTVGSSKINTRFASIWKVQNTNNVGQVRVMWPAGITNLHLVQSIDPAITSTDTFTPMTGTQIIGGVTYNYADVSLVNGQYFTFAGFTHAPGGVVSGLTHWYRSDKEVGVSGSTVSAWKDQVQGVVSSQISTSPLPSYVNGAANYFNFNPGINFTATNQKLGNINVRTITSDNYDIFSLVKDGAGGNRVFGIGRNNTEFNSNNWESPALTTGAYVERKNLTGAVIYGASLTASAANIPSIKYNTFNPTSFTNGVNGGALVAPKTHTALGTPTGGHLFGSNQGAGTSGDDEGFTGNIGELIIYGAGSITNTERRRVDTYLAIKYGITLDRTATDNYLSSSSDIVWDGAGNTGYNNNIAGIARDEFSSLHQKQSISVNPGKQVLIGLTTIANTNMENTGNLTDGQFLLWGDNGLAKSLSETINGIEDANFRFASIWKVENTDAVGEVRVMWPVGLTNLKLIQSIDPTFDGNDTITDMSANTQVIGGVTYNYADVTFADGEYFTFAGFAHAPGGVVGTDFWVKSDDAGAIATAWKDHSINNNPIENIGGMTLSAANKAHNFHPFTTGYTNSKYFRETNSSLTVYEGGLPYGTHSRSSSSIFSTVRPTSLGTGRIVGMDDTNNDWLGEIAISINGGKPKTHKYYDGIRTFTTTPSFTANRSAVFSSIQDQSTTRARLGLDGSYETSGTGSNFHVIGPYMNIGYGSYDSNGPFPGDIMEVIWYKRALSENEQSRVNSYLAIKNGTTLAENYLSSGSTIVWDRSVNTTFNNNIFGIGNDKTGSLNQKVSNSVNSSSILIASTINDFTSSNQEASRTELDDHSFLILGDNNNTSTVPYTPAEIGDCGELIGGGDNEIKLIPRKWLAQRTNDIGTTYLQLNFASYSGGINSDIMMFVADDANFTQNVVMVPGTQSGNNWTFAHNFDNENAARYITFGGTFVAAPCEQCQGGTYTLRTGYQWNQGLWGNQTANAKTNILLGNDAEGIPLQASMYADYTENPSIEYSPSTYPVQYGGRWTISRRYDNTNSKARHRIDLTQAMKASFQISNINTFQNNKNNFEVIGYCNGAPVMPRITYAYNTSYHTFNIENNKTIGTMSWRGFVPNVSTANVRFDRPVDRIEIICSVERVNTSRTLRSILYSDITLECAEVVEPTPDNVYVSHNFTQETLATCGGETTMRIKVTNNNLCEDKTIALHQLLPAGLSYVPDSFNGNDLPAGALDNATLTYSGGSLELSGLTLPRGEHWMYVDIANPGTAGTYPTQFTFEVTDGLDPNHTYYSSIVNLNYYESTEPQPAAPTLQLSIKDNVSCGENDMDITYRMKIDNPNAGGITGAEILHMFDYDQTIESVVFVTGEDEDGIVTGDYPMDGSGNPITPVGSSLFNLVDAVIPEGVTYIDITVNVGNSYDIPEVQALGISSSFLVGFGSGECAESAESVSNQAILRMCSACVKPGATGTPLPSSVGILTKEETSVTGWPESVPNGYLVLDGAFKGMVITHMTTAQINALTPVEGMLVFDTDEACVKLYRGAGVNAPVVHPSRQGWVCIERGCNE